MKKSGLGDSPFFSEPLGENKPVTPPSEKLPEKEKKPEISKKDEQQKKSNQATMIP